MRHEDPPNLRKTDTTHAARSCTNCHYFLLKRYERPVEHGECALHDTHTQGGFVCDAFEPAGNVQPDPDA